MNLNVDTDMTGDSKPHQIKLSDTEVKIFNEVINIISQIEDIKQETEAERMDFLKLKQQMEEVGLEYPEERIVNHD